MEEKKFHIKRKTVYWIAGIGLAVLAAGSFGAAVYSGHQLKKCLRTVSRAADSVSGLTEIDIRESIMERAVEQAARREVARVVERAARGTERDLSEETSHLVREAVKRSRGALQKTVADAIAREAAQVDRSEMLEEATERCKELLVERFDGKLDGLMSDYQRNLDNVGKIYQSIAASMADKAGKDVTLKIG